MDVVVKHANEAAGVRELVLEPGSSLPEQHVLGADLKGRGFRHCAARAPGPLRVVPVGKEFELVERVQHKALVGDAEAPDRVFLRGQTRGVAQRGESPRHVAPARLKSVERHKGDRTAVAVDVVDQTARHGLSQDIDHVEGFQGNR